MNLNIIPHRYKLYTLNEKHKNSCRTLHNHRDIIMSETKLLLLLENEERKFRSEIGET